MHGNRRRSYTARPANRINKKQVANTLKMVGILLAVLLVVLFSIKTFVTAAPNEDTFCEGVSINGVSLAGMTYEEGVQAVEQSIQDRLHNSSYILTYQGQSWTFTPAAFEAELNLDEEIQLAWNFGHVGSDSERRASAEYLKNNPINYEKAIEFDEVQLEDFIEQIINTINVEPVDASVTVGSSEILTINPSSTGLGLSRNGVKQILLDAIYNDNTAPIELKPSVLQPKYTTEDLEKNTKKIVFYSTSLKQSSAQRNKNVWRALSRFNGFIVKPGERISFNKVVGKRTLENGFFEAKEFDGSSVIDGVGGGTCQASSTLYAALLMAGIDVDVRSNHSMAVSYCKASLDAAVSDTGKDLEFTNNLAYPIYIYTACDSDAAYITIYGPPSQYDIVVDSVKTGVIEPRGYRTEKDTSGKHAWYVDELVLKSEGKNGGRSHAYRDYYDKTTGELVERQIFATDSYEPLKPTYYVGIHGLDEPKPE
ncbi:MAG: VanW family protein [Clostridia bacterium]|nr:VanW family protein [Clostridia bacterium]